MSLSVKTWKTFLEFHHPGRRSSEVFCNAKPPEYEVYVDQSWATTLLQVDAWKLKFT